MRAFLLGCVALSAEAASIKALAAQALEASPAPATGKLNFGQDGSMDAMMSPDEGKRHKNLADQTPQEAAAHQASAAAAAAEASSMNPGDTRDMCLLCQTFENYVISNLTASAAAHTAAATAWSAFVTANQTYTDSVTVRSTKCAQSLNEQEAMLSAKRLVADTTLDVAKADSQGFVDNTQDLYNKALLWKNSLSTCEAATGDASTDVLARETAKTGYSNANTTAAQKDATLATAKTLAGKYCSAMKGIYPSPPPPTKPPPAPPPPPTKPPPATPPPAGGSLTNNAHTVLSYDLTSGTFNAGQSGAPALVDVGANSCNDPQSWVTDPIAGVGQVLRVKSGRGVYIPNIGNYLATGLSSSYSFRIVLNMDSTSGWKRILNVAHGHDHGYYINNNINTYPDSTGSQAIPVSAGAWHSFTCATQRPNMACYLDGTQKTTWTPLNNWDHSAEITSPEFLFFNDRDDSTCTNGGEHTAMYVKSIQVFTGVLTDVEVAALEP